MNIEESILINAYVQGKLTDQERSAVEQRMKEDADFRENVLLEKQLLQEFNDKEWSTIENEKASIIDEYESAFKDQETKDLQKTIVQVNKAYRDSSISKKSKPWLYIVAAIVLVIIVINVIPKTVISSQDLYNSYYEYSDLPSLVYRNDDADNIKLVQAQEFFEKGKYENALALLLEAPQEVITNKATIYLYTGISQLELKQYDKAMETFDMLSKSNLMDASKGLWYKALVFLKIDDKIEAEKALNQIVENETNYNFNEAKALLKKL